MGHTQRSRRLRSLAGLLVALPLASLMMGVLACILPVPVGDPESSRIDERISGVWYGQGLGGDTGVSVFRPWDGRTWLLTDYEFSFPTAEEGYGTDADTAGVDGFLDALESASLEQIMIFKTWMTRLGGVDFLTLEMATSLGSEAGISPIGWYVVRVEVHGDTLGLTHIDYEHAEFDTLESEGFDMAQGRDLVEAAITRNARNPEFFDSEAARLHRLPMNRYDELAEILQDITSVWTH